MGQRIFRSDDTSPWGNRYGSASNGVFAPGNATDAPIDSATTGTNATTSLSATNASFAPGQIILIHQTVGTGAGNIELNTIQSYSVGTITTGYPLVNTYNSGAQVLVLKQYSTATIGGAVTYSAKPWNGTTGGILGWVAASSTTISGILFASGCGYRGAQESGVNLTGDQGESSLGTGTKTQSANGAGGGGGNGNGNSNAGAGGGGGHATSGQTGSGSQPGTGGGTVGAAALINPFFGAAGGGGGGNNSSTNNIAGANGGGFIFIISPIITVTGSINNDGLAGAMINNGAFGASGGAAGGSTLLKGQIINIGTNLLTVAAGAGGTNGVGANTPAGAGGVGRIHADYGETFSGSTSPGIDTRLDTTLNNTGFLITF